MSEKVKFWLLVLLLALSLVLVWYVNSRYNRALLGNLTTERYSIPFML